MLKDKCRLWPATDDKPIVPLQRQDAEKIRLGWNSYFCRQSLVKQVQQRPDMAFMVEGTGDFIIGDHWRHREEIGYVLETHSKRCQDGLLDRVVGRCSDKGCQIVLVAPEEQSEKPRIYREFGFKPIERVIYYELLNPNRKYDVREISPSPYVGCDFNDLLELDNSSFPWLWWNSEGEFETYLSYPNVELFLTYHEDRLVGYYSISTFKGWGHLDRLAVAPEEQGKGFGAAQLASAIRNLRERDAKRVTLTTQENNRQSRKLYESFGFDRPGGDYWIYGLWLKEAVAEA
jgi:GNAT superfamily N-acetyltransferase